jgi:hypothetical protein
LKSYDIHLRKQDLSLCREFKGAVLGYGVSGVADGYLSSIYLSTNDSVFKFGVTQFDLDDHFECFGLKLTNCENAWDKITERLDWKNEINEVSILIRSEGIFPDYQNTFSQSVGVPRNIQKVLIDNQPYGKPLAVCNIACGIKIKNSVTDQLMIYADTLPFSMCLTLGSDKMMGELDYFTEIPLDEYTRSVNQ